MARPKAGDVVCLQSDGIKLTVAKLYDDKTCRVVWTAGDELRFAIVEIDALKVV